MKKLNSVSLTLLLIITSFSAGIAQENEGRNTADHTVNESNENNTGDCSGCKLSLTTDNGSVDSTGKVKMDVLDITDPSLDSCNGNDVYQQIDFQLSVTPEKVKEKCSADCGPAKCSANLAFELKVPNGMTDICVVKGAQPTFRLKYNNSIDTIGPATIIEAFQNNGGVIPINTLPFSQDCGQSTPLDVSAYIEYTAQRIIWDSTVTPPVVLHTFSQQAIKVYDMGNLAVTCKACVENNNDTERSKLRQPDGIEPINVYPNPVNNQINFVFNSTAVAKVVLSITNLVGQTVHQSNHSINIGETQFSVDVSDLTNGTYFYTYTINGTVQQGKMMVQH